MCVTTRKAPRKNLDGQSHAYPKGLLEARNSIQNILWNGNVSKHETKLLIESLKIIESGALELIYGKYGYNEISL